MEKFCHEELISNLRKKNIYYDDLITGNILQPLQIQHGAEKMVLLII